MNRSWAITLFAAAALVVSACGSARESPRTGAEGGRKQAADGLTGVINVDGSSTVLPVTERAAEQFRQAHPGVDIAVGRSGTGGGFKKFCRGETHISNASRPIEPDEAQACQQAGIDYVEFKVGLDGITNLVNPANNFARCLTVQQLRDVWNRESKVNNWSQVAPNFPSKPLTLFGPGPDSGTFDFFVEEVLGEDTEPRRDYTASEDDNVIVQGVVGKDGALGYVGYAYFVENRQKLKALAVDAGQGCVEPTDQTIESGGYFLSRPLFIYVSKKALEEPHVREFVRFYVQNSGELSQAAGYVALSQGAQQEAMQKFQEATAS